MAIALDQSREIFILGAGFSKSISAAMPLTDGLGAALAAEDPVTFSTLGDGSFETWLSHRAEAQPYLNASANLERRAVFARATAQIAAVLDAAIAQALAETLPTWLAQLISLWHSQSADVLTFNYDPLIECAFETLQFCDWRTGDRFQWGSLLNYNPTGKAGSSYGEVDGTAGPHPSFRLWKLHGSTNWFWSPGDATGASAVRVALPGHFGAPRPVNEAAWHWMAPGRERLLVPPSALKSPYYANPVTREIWSRAFEALRSANSVTLIGYSLPQTDLTTVGMLTEAFHTGQIRQVNIVDPQPSAIARRVRAMAPSTVDVVEVADDSPVPRYVAALLAAAAARAVASLADAQPSEQAHVVTTWGDFRAAELHGRTAAITNLKRAPGSREVKLEATQLTTFEGATAAWGDGRPRPLAFADIRDALNGAESLTVSIGGSSEPSTIIDYTTRQANTGHGDGTWVQLIPAGAAPE